MRSLRCPAGRATRVCAGAAVVRRAVQIRWGFLVTVVPTLARAAMFPQSTSGESQAPERLSEQAQR